MIVAFASSPTVISSGTSPQTVSRIAVVVSVVVVVAVVSSVVVVVCSVVVVPGCGVSPFAAATSDA